MIQLCLLTKSNKRPVLSGGLFQARISLKNSIQHPGGILWVFQVLLTLAFLAFTPWVGVSELSPTTLPNAETNGFKVSRAEFQDMLSTSLKAEGRGNGADQLGTGVKLSTVKLLMNQGDISRTESSTDLAINGDGFFRLSTPLGMAYSRDGSMHFDRDGNLVNSDGYMVQGFQADSKGNITTRMAPIKVHKQTINARSTENIKMDMNLDSRGEVLKFDIENPDYTSNFAHSVTVYDNVGTPRIVTLYYNKESDNTWTYRALVDGQDARYNDPLIGEPDKNGCHGQG